MTTLADRAVHGYARWSCGLLITIGLLAILRGRFEGFADDAGVSVLGFTASPLTSLLHLLAGLGGVLLVARQGGERRFALWLGAGATVFGVVGLALGDSSADVFGRNLRMSLLDLVVGLAGLVAWWWAMRAARPVASEPLSPG